jgi:hypothetical protein
MPQNQIFERPEYRRRSLSASLTDVTKTARQWDAVFAMRVHSELLGKYTAPNVADDDEGYYLVGALVQEIDAALDGRMPSRLVSYGKFLALDFTFLARCRRTSSEEVLNLRAVLGPCDGSHPFVCVVTAPPARASMLAGPSCRRPGEGGSPAEAGRSVTPSQIIEDRLPRCRERVSFRQVPSAGTPRIRPLSKLPPSQRPQIQSDLWPVRASRWPYACPPPARRRPPSPRPREVRTVAVPHPAKKHPPLRSIPAPRGELLHQPALTFRSSTPAQGFDSGFHS